MSSSERAEVSPAEHSMCAAESNLAADAPWKKIQKNTFTRWCNEHLRPVDRVIEDLQFDLNDGLTLIALLEVLSHKRMFRRYHTRPAFRQMRLDNVSVALEFLEQENIKLVSIDSKAIVDGNMKLILGLVWTLILHYSISSPLLGDGGHDKAKKQTPELRLLGWIQEKVPELPITNFSEDWMDGKALGALVDGLAPGLCPDWESWDEVQRVDNAREAMQQADEWLGVPQVIAPEEIIDPRVDEQSIMTYLSMFPKAQLKPGAPLKPKSVSKPKACRASGRGLQPKGLRVAQTADFKVDTSRAGPGHLEVHVKGPDGSDVPAQQKEFSDDLYSLQYRPAAEGNHTVEITWAGEHILKSPFEVWVGPKAGPQMVRAWGPGLEGGVVGMSADFVVESVCADPGTLGFAIEGPSQARIECDDQEDGSCDVRFWPTEPGDYAVHVICDEEDIQDSPFMSHISPNKKKCYPHKVKVFGPGVSETGFVLNCAIEFTVDTRFAGDGSLVLLAQNSDGGPVSVEVVRKDNGVYTCLYKPTSPGKHTIFVSWGGVGVPGSPFRVGPARVRIEPAYSKKRPKGSRIPGEGTDQDLANSTDPLYKLDLNVTSPTKLPCDATKVKAYGPGLKGGVVDTLSEFIVDTSRSGSGHLSVTVDGPRPTKIKCLDNEDGTCTVTYLPTKHGEHLINVLFQGAHIPGSPFRADVHMPFDPSKVVVSGPGLTKAKVGEPCVVNIDCALAGLGDLSVEAVSESGHRAKTKVRENQDGTYTVVYVPLTAGVYTLRLKYGGKVLANFPSEVMVDPAVYTSNVKVRGSGAEGEDLNGLEGECDPANVFVNGVGLLQGVTGQSNSFTVTTRGTGAGGLAVTVEGPSDAKISCIDKQDGRYDVQYIPDVPGLYDINITCQGEHILGSPFKVPVKDPSNARNVKVSGPGVELGVCAQVTQTFTIDCSKTGEAPESVAVMTPSGTIQLVGVTDNGDGTYSVAYSPSMEGAHSLVVKYADEEAFSSPVAFHVLPTSNANQLKVSGPGLQSRLCPKVPQTFTIDCSKTGEAPESVAVMTPSGKMELVEVTDNGDGTYSVAYSPSVEGAHSLVVKYADEDECHSPIQFKVLPTNDTNKLKVSGPGLQSGHCANVPQTFTIDCSKTGEAPESVAVMTPCGKMELVEVVDNGDGTYSVAYSPSMEGAHSLVVKYADEDEFCSPFQFQVLPSDSNRKLNVSVPGLESGVCAQIPQTFTIDSKTGDTPESVAVMTPSGKMELVEVTDNGDGTYSVAYSPSMEGAHSVMVKYADEEDFSSVSDFQVLPTNDTNKLKVSGPGLQSGHCAKVPQIFTIDCGKTGEPPESVAVMTPSGGMELVEVTDNGDGTYSVAYSPSMEGAHSLVVKYADEDEFCSPYNFQVLPTNDANKLKVSGPGLKSGLCAKSPQIFTIDNSKTGEAPESVAVMTPNGKMELVEVTDNGDGTYSVAYSPSMEGAHSVMVKYADEDEFCSPFQFQVLPGDSNRKLNVSVPGLKSGVCAQIPQSFTIDSKTGDAPESVAVMTPSGEMEIVEVTDNGDGTYSVAYSPSIDGAHSVMVKYADEEDFSSLSDFQVLPTNDTNKLKVSGPGLQSGLCAKVPQIFTIDSGKTGEPPESVAVRTPSGKMELVEVTDNGDGTYSVAYSPSMEGAHSLVVKYADEDEFFSPFQFQVLPGDSNRKLNVSVPGLESGVCAQIPQTFTIDSKTGEAPESVAVMTPSGEMELVEVTDNGDGTYSVAYSPSMEGSHSVMVKYADEEEFCSVSDFQVLPTNDTNKLKVYGPGLQSGLCAKVLQNFTIDCCKNGEVPESVAVRTPCGNMELVEVTDNGDGTYSVSYSPSMEGAHFLVVKYADEDEFCSPFQFQVLPGDSNRKLNVSVPGLESGVCAQIPQTFTIDSKTGDAPESVAVMTPSGKMELVEVTDNGDGTYSVAYSPSMEGAHSVMVKYADEEDFCSLSDFQVLPTNDANKLKVSGSGLQTGLCSKVPQIFTIDCSKNGKVPESVAVMTPSGKMELVEVTDNGDGTYSVSYSPSMEGAHSLVVKYDDEDEFCSPFQFQVLAGDSNRKLNVSVPGLESGVCAQIPQTFTIDSKTGVAPESVAVMTPSGKMELVEVTDNGDGTYSVAYSPSMEGAHSVMVKYADEEEFSSLSDFQVLPTNDNNKLKVSGPALQSGHCAKVPQIFTIDCSKNGEAPESVAVMTPSGKMELVEVTDNGDGTYSVSYSPSMEGAHSLVVKYADEDEFCSPYSFQVLPTNDTNKLKVSGPGLQSGLCGKVPQTFTIDCSKTGEAPESVAVMTPSGKMELMEVVDNGDGTYSVAYSPSMEGAHSLVVKYADEDEFCSPFQFQVLPGDSNRKLNVSVPGLESGVCAQIPQTFTIDSKAGDAPESVAVITPSGKMELVEVTDNGDGTYSVAYSPSMEGAHSVMVKYADEEDLSSLSDFQVLPTNDTNKLKVSSPGLQSGLCAKVPQTFTIDCSKNGKAPDSVAVMTPCGKMELVEVTDNGDGTYSVAYSPSMEGVHSLVVKYADEDEFCCPYNFKVLPTKDTNKLKVSGPGLQSGLCAKVPQIFTIDCSKNGEVPESVAVMTPCGKMELMEVVDNGDGTYSVSYSPYMEGAHSLVVKYADEDEFCSPFQFQVLPGDSNRKLNVSVPGLESGVCAQIPQSFTIDSKTGEAPESVAVMTPSGKMELVEVTDNGDGTYSVAYSPSVEGAHSVMVKYADEEEFSSLSDFQVVPTNDANNLKVSGPGLQSGLCAKVPQIFTIDCSKNGEAPESVAVRTPSGRMELVEVTDNGDGTYSVAYSPSMEGAHSLVVKYADEIEFCSPYNFHVVPTNDAINSKVSDPALYSRVCAKVSQSFTIDCSKTGEAPESVAIVMPNGKLEIVEVTDNGDGTYSVAYSPSMEGAHSLVVKYADEDEFCSPFQFHVRSRHDASKVRASGPGLTSGLPASLPAQFTVDATQAGEGQLSVGIIDPESKERRASIQDNHNGTYDVSYIPDKAGGYQITIRYGGDEIPTSPYHVLATATGNADKCIVTGPGLGSIIGTGQEIGFVVNTQSAGTGKVSCFVLTPEGAEVEADVIEREDGTFEICYTASQPGNYIISAGFGGESLFTSPFEVMAPDNDLDLVRVRQQSDLRQKARDGLQPLMRHGSYIPLSSVNTTGLMPLDIVMASGLPEGEIIGEVCMPSGSRAQAEVVANRDGTVSLMYDPTEEGLHQMHITINGTTIPASPLQFYVNNASNSHLMAHGPGLVYGTSNEIAAFSIFNKDLALGELDIALEGPSKAEICCLNNRDGTCTVTYLPTAPGDYNILVRHNEDHITGSPFKAKIAGSAHSPQKSQVRLGTVADFTLDISEDDISLLTASITSPSGLGVSCLLKRQPDSHIGISFIPKEVGEHLVSVMKDGQHVANSPIPLNITPLEIGDASRVKVFGPGLATGRTCEMSDFVVDTREAGYGGLSLSIEGPSDVEIQTEELEDGTCGVSFCTTEPGAYTVSVKFADEHVPGSPFRAQVTKSGHARKSVTHYQGPATVASVGTVCGINLKIPGLDSQHISAQVSCPSGATEEATVSTAGNDIYTVSFVPSETGVHAVGVVYRGQPVAGSPYEYTVGLLGEGGPEKVKVWGQGLQSAEASVPADFSIWAREAGVGNLSVTVEGPGWAELVFDDREDGSCGISYMAQEPGDYELSVKFNDEHIRDSPFLVPVYAPADDILGQTKNTGLQIKRLTSGHGASSLWSSFLSDASKVVSSGPGLEKAFIGRRNTFSVDCSTAGTNLLLVGMHGPTIPCEEVSIKHLRNNLYDVSYVVNERGSYILAIKWGEEHIPGSPFLVVVS